MPPGHEIDYDALIDRAIKDFEPVKRLWPAGARLFFWVLLEAAILVLTGVCLSYRALPSLLGNTGLMLTSGLPIFASIAAAFLAFRSAVPGREVTSQELALLVAACAVAMMVGSEPPVRSSGLSESVISIFKLFGLAALPWSILFWAIRRGVPLQPAKTGSTIGLAAFCFSVAVLRLIDYAQGFANRGVWLAISGVLITALSALAGRAWLDWTHQWQQSPGRGEARISISWVGARTGFALALAVSTVTLIGVLRGARGALLLPIPDFDLTIDGYQRSLAGFRSNVPSASIDTALTTYIERGMPAYMWDFGPGGFKFVGGRWQPLADGTPVTYTWFRGAKGGVICMMRQVDGFNPPPAPHEEHHNLLFYRYRGFSLCLINIGGYGNFIGVIAAPMPMRQFIVLVLAAVH